MQFRCTKFLSNSGVSCFVMQLPAVAKFECIRFCSVITNFCYIFWLYQVSLYKYPSFLHYIVYSIYYILYTIYYIRYNFPITYTGISSESQYMLQGNYILYSIQYIVYSIQYIRYSAKMMGTYTRTPDTTKICNKNW